jgi:hypothetical protein
MVAVLMTAPSFTVIVTIGSDVTVWALKARLTEVVCGSTFTDAGAVIETLLLLTERTIPLGPALPFRTADSSAGTQVP